MENKYCFIILTIIFLLHFVLAPPEITFAFEEDDQNILTTLDFEDYPQDSGEISHEWLQSKGIDIYGEPAGFLNLDRLSGVISSTGIVLEYASPNFGEQDAGISDNEIINIDFLENSSCYVELELVVIPSDTPYINNKTSTILIQAYDSSGKLVKSENKTFTGVTNGVFTPATVSISVEQPEIKKVTLQAIQYPYGGIFLEGLCFSQDSGKVPDPELSNEKDILSFSIAGEEGTIEGDTITVKVPFDINLIDLATTFESSPLSTVKVGGIVQESGITTNDYRNPVTYTVVAEDGSAKKYLVTVTRIIPLSFTITDSIMDPIKPIIYLTDKTNKKLYSINYETKEISYITFDLPPESLVYGNGKVYVSLLKGQHDNTWGKEDQKGAVAVVDADDLTKLNQFDVNIDPFDLVADRSGYLYILSGSGQWTYIKGYNLATEQETASATIRQRSYAQIHPTMNRIYTIDTDSTGRGFRAYNISDGSFTDPTYPGGYASPDDGSYLLTPKFQISPDGKYIFNGAGTVFTCNEAKDQDMKYVTKLDSGFSDIAFDIENERFFTGAADNQIRVYEYKNGSTSFAPKGTYLVQGSVEKLFFQNNTLIAIIKNNNKYFLEKIDLDSEQSFEKDILSFSIAGEDGIIEGNTITVKIPLGVNLIDLAATFESSPLSTVKVGGIVQESGITTNDFRNPVTYTVVAEDGSTKNYTVKVTNYNESGKITYGDANSDGEITVEDKDLILSYLQGTVSLADVQMIAADVSGDGKVTEEDAAMILDYLEGSIEEFFVERLAKIPLSFTITDSIMDPIKPVLYLTDKTNKKLYSINYETKEISYITFDLPPESLVYGNGKVYVSLLKGLHSLYWWEEDQKGAVAAVDAEDFTKLDQFDVNIDPFDLVVDRSGYLYILSGSGQLTYIKGYSLETKQETSSANINQMSYAQMHPTLNRIYTVDTEWLTPIDFRAYNISNGSFTDPTYPGGYDSPYHGDYSLTPKFQISPDGKYIFNGAGTVFTCNETKAQDMKYVTKLDSGFSDIAFDIENERFFTGLSNNKIKVYDYKNGSTSFAPKGTYVVQGSVEKLFFQNNRLICISKDKDNYLVSKINPGFIDGDLNGDGCTDIKDLTPIAQKYGTGNWETDLNYDGIVDIYDLIALAKKINGL